MLYHNSQLCTIRLNDYNTLLHFEIESYTYFGPLVSKIICSTIKIMSNVCSLSALGDKLFIPRIRKFFLAQNS
jgi:hypothetical protein